jgi:hypothetical protein
MKFQHKLFNERFIFAVSSKLIPIVCRIDQKNHPPFVLPIVLGVSCDIIFVSNSFNVAEGHALVLGSKKWPDRPSLCDVDCLFFSVEVENHHIQIVDKTS